MTADPPALSETLPPTGEERDRIAALDFLRGVAVLGILAMNIIGFALPMQAGIVPDAYGMWDSADFIAWVTTTLLVDGRMRALFSILFGASMLLVIERAEAKGEDKGLVHRRRMLWLLAFGLVHYHLIWIGDILTNYAVIGLIAYLFADKPPRRLLQLGLAFLGLGLFIYLLLFGLPALLEWAATRPAASPDLVREWRGMEAAFALGEAGIARDIAVHRGGYAGIFTHRLDQGALGPLNEILSFGPETLGLMLIGMSGLKSGFLTGAWEAARYRRIAAIGIGIGLAGYGAIAWLTAASGFATGATLALTLFVGAMFRPVVAIGYAALLLLILDGRGTEGRIVSRLIASGRAAFSNYLGTSLVATWFFYGYGLGLYGEFGRAELYLIVAGFWALMLLWSKPWLARYRYGPFEWLWRSLARGKPQPMRKLVA